MTIVGTEVVVIDGIMHLFPSPLASTRGGHAVLWRAIARKMSNEECYIAVKKVDGQKSTRGLRTVVAKDSGERRPRSSPSLAI
jgi:hypothetical protein